MPRAGPEDPTAASAPLAPLIPADAPAATRPPAAAPPFERGERHERVEPDERYRILFASSPVPTLVYSLATYRILEANPAALRAYGYDEAEFLALTYEDLLAAPARQPDRRSSVGISTRAETEVHRRKDGTAIEVNVHARGLQVAGSEAMLVHLEDVGERRQLSERLYQARKLEAIGRLAGGVAHDFNNLLSVVSTAATLALEALPRDPTVVHAELLEIKTAAHRAADLTRQLLAFGKKQPRELKTIDLRAFLEELRPTLTRAAGPAIALHVHLGAVPCPVLADSSQLEQITMNLVVNARDAMPAGGTLRLELSEGALEEREPGRAERFVVLRVEDTGHGIPDAVLSRIFEPFYTTKKATGGTGLGLSTVLGIVEQSGGTVRVRSVVGKGTTFSVSLPLAPGLSSASSDEEAASEGPPVSSVPPSEEVHGGHETLLLVEDDAQVRSAIRRLLRTLGYVVIEAPSAEAAFTVLSAHTPPIDLVLSDVLLPGAGGEELARVVLDSHPGLPVVLMTGQDEPSTAAFVLAKPFSRTALAQTLRRALEVAQRSRRPLR